MFVPLTPLQFYRRAAGLFGAKVGVVDGDRRFTYREFGQRVERLAGALRRLGLAAGDRVSFMTYNTHHLLEAYYGVPSASGVLNPINIRLAPQEIAYIVGHAASRVLFFHSEFAPLVQQLRPQLS
ncbi:MAG: AMP-binding protein, partial [Dehalococcoidia bacterium]